MSKSQRIGVFGGTFDPIHTGHLVATEQIREKLDLEKILFIPCWIQPFKQKNKITSAADRLFMTKLAIQGNSYFQVSDIEIKRKKVSYTVETLRELKRKYKNKQLYLILGSDNIRAIKKWYKPEEIFQLAKVVFVTRPGINQALSLKLPENSIRLAINGVNISSTQIREKVKKGESIKYLVPERVEKFIRANKLYLK